MLRYCVTLSACVLVALVAFRAGEASSPVSVPGPVQLVQERDANAEHAAARPGEPRRAAAQRRRPAQRARRATAAKGGRPAHRRPSPRRDMHGERAPAAATPRAPVRSTRPELVADVVERVRKERRAASPAPLPVSAPRIPAEPDEGQRQGDEDRGDDGDADRAVVAPDEPAADD